MASTDQTSGLHKSNIAKPLSRLPLARTSPTTASIHQDDPSRLTNIPRMVASNSKRQVVRPLGESNNTPVKPTFGWIGKRGNSITSPPPTSVVIRGRDTMDITPPNSASEITVVDNENENENSTAIQDKQVSEILQPVKRRPRPSLSERTTETLSQVSPAPSPVRRRSSTVRSGGSMGPPPRPASAVSNVRPNTPSTPSSGHPASPTKKTFRPPGKVSTPAKHKPAAPSMDKIYTPPRAFMRDHCSRIGRPARDTRRSISTTMNFAKDDTQTTRTPSHPVRMKSMYDLRTGVSRTPTSKSGIAPPAKNPSTPKTLSREPSFKELSPQTSLLKARGPGENVIASTSKIAKPASKVSNQAPASLPQPCPRIARRTITPHEPQKREASATNPTKSSAALRDTIAKAKAARRDQLQKSSLGIGQADDASELDADLLEPTLSIGEQSLKKKLQNAVSSGVLNLSAMSLREMPADVFSMYDYKEDSGASWSEAVDLKKLILADNEFVSLPEIAFPDWSPDQLREDSEKNNQFGGLEMLDLHGNSLTSMPIGIRRLQQLHVLNLSSNNLNITVFSVISELKNLRELRLAKNGLHGDLPSQSFSLPNLQVLDLTNNQLDNLPSSLMDLQGLQKLLLGGNRLSCLKLSTLPSQSLTELDLSRNMLGNSFDAEGLKGFEKLQTLDLSFNNLECLSSSFFDLPSLQTLAIHNNRIDTLPDMSKCAQLSTLTASENGLTSIPDGFCSLKQLKNVDFGGNSIRTIGPEIIGMESLTAFNIAGNPLRERKYLTMNLEEIKADFAKKSGTLEAVQVSATQSEPTQIQGQEEPQSEIPEESATFKPKSGVLDASSRSLSSLLPSQVDLSTPIHTIRLANNDLTEFPVELLMHPSVRWSLRSLDMSHNPGLHPTEYLVSEVHLPLLQTLYIVSTGLTTLESLTTYLKAPELKELNISCHRLTGHLPWVRAWYPAMTTLLASDNWFDSIDVEAVRGLEVLDVRSNEIELLPAKIGLLGNHAGKVESGRLRSFECTGNKFRVPRLMIIEKGTEATLRDLRRMIPSGDIPEEWLNEV